jgi:aryl-alcohol dehydrogenase-like predicted oxidoreductase
MQTRRLGTTEMQITPIGFGAWAIGGGNWEFGWGPQDEGQALAAIRRAVDLGVNWIDTAAVYGLGRSEMLVARATRGMRPRPYVFTKCGLVWDDGRKVTGRLERDSVRRECEASLRRLATEAIDLYQIHWPDPDRDVEAAWETLIRLKEEGKVRNIGVSNFDTAQMRRAQRLAPIASLQPPYSLVNRAAEREILPFCKEQDIGVIVYSPMASGLLSGAMTRERIAAMPPDDWRRRGREFQEPRLSRNLKLAATLARIGARHGRSAGEVAIAWTLRNPAVTGAIVGGRSAAQVEGVAGAATLSLEPADVREIEAQAAGD